MIYKTDKIADLLRKPNASDPLVISPEPDVDKLMQSPSGAIDLRLGTWFSKVREGRTGYLALGKSTPGDQLTKNHYVPFGKSYFLHPSSFILGVVLEWLRIPEDMAGYVICKSKWGRRGLVIATATGIHPGFTGCLTLELTNVGEVPIELSPGVAVCQLFLHSAEGLSSTERENLPERVPSKLAGYRKPLVGDPDLDDFAQSLGRAKYYKGTSGSFGGPLPSAKGAKAEGLSALQKSLLFEGDE